MTTPSTPALAADAMRDLHTHRRWVRAKMLAAAQQCSDEELRRTFEMGVGSLFGTLVHLWGAETVWANVLEEGDAAFSIPGASAFASVDALIEAWKPLDARWDALLDKAADPTFLAKPMVRVRDGKSYTTSARDIYLHVATHQHYHAAQVSNMLRQMGKSLGSSDFIMFARERWMG